MKKILKPILLFLSIILLSITNVMFNTEKTYAEENNSNKMDIVNGELRWYTVSTNRRPDWWKYRTDAWRITITNLDTGIEKEVTVYPKDSDKAIKGGYVGFYSEILLEELEDSVRCKVCNVDKPRTPGVYNGKPCVFCVNSKYGAGWFDQIRTHAKNIIPIETLEKLTGWQLTKGNYKYVANASINYYLKNKDGSNNFNHKFKNLISKTQKEAIDNWKKVTGIYEENGFYTYYEQHVEVNSYAVWVHDTENRFDLSKIKLSTISDKKPKTTSGSANSNEFYGWADKDTMAEVDKNSAKVAAKKGFKYDESNCILKIDRVTGVSHIYLKAVPWTNKVTYNLNGGEGNTPVGFTHTYGTVDRIEATNPVKAGHTFKGWRSTTTGEIYQNGSVYDDTFAKKINKDGGEDILIAQWDVNTYTFEYLPNGGEGTIVKESYIATTDIIMKENEFTLNESAFLGWSLNTGAVNPEYKEKDKISVMDIIKAYGVQYQTTATIPIYAIWDAIPRINANNRYFSLLDAQDGYITIDILFEKAKAYDTEDGEIPQGTQFYLTSFDPSKYTKMTSEGKVYETFTAIDSAGNKIEKTIIVNIIDTNTPLEDVGGNTNLSAGAGYTRAISIKYLYAASDEGGLMENSIWREPENFAYLEKVLSIKRVNPEIRTVNFLGMSISKEVPGSGEWSDNIVQEWVFTPEDVKKVKDYVDEHGFGNSKEPDALEGFLEEFGDCRKK